MTLTRRTVLRNGGAALASLGTASQVATAAETPSSPENTLAQGGATYVLVHGTWHGGWVWRDVADRLIAQGHRVFTPTCTGCGERLHLTGPEVGLETHISDIVNVIEYEELSNVILVGHSFSGITITGVADRLRDRIERIVFFDALVPRPGRMSGVTKDSATGEYPAWWRARQQHFIAGYQMDLWQDYPMDMLVPPEYPDVAAKLRRLITPHPAKQWTDTLVLKNGGWAGLQPTYFHCVGQTYRKSSDLMVGPARGPDWRFVELDIPRDGMLTHPDLVADELAQTHADQRTAHQSSLATL